MHYLIYGKSRKRPLTELYRIIHAINPEIVVCTGGFENLKGITEHRYLERRLKRERKKLITVTGKDDYKLVQRLEIERILEEENEEDTTTKRKSLEHLIKLTKDRGKKVCIAHRLDSKSYGNLWRSIIINGALRGQIDENYDECNRLLHTYLESYNDHELNFEAMRLLRNSRIMIRTQGDEQSITMQNKTGNIFQKEIKKFPISFDLDENSRYVITTGAYSRGVYITIKTKKGYNPRITFHQLIKEKIEAVTVERDSSKRKISKHIKNGNNTSHFELQPIMR